MVGYTTKGPVTANEFIEFCNKKGIKLLPTQRIFISSFFPDRGIPRATFFILGPGRGAGCTFLLNALEQFIKEEK